MKDGSDTTAEPRVGKRGEDEEFRNNLGTADKEGRRQFVYPKKPQGRLYRWRSFFSIFQLGLLLGAPFIKIDGQPLLMLNIIERKFVILGQVFWPQDLPLFALGMLCLFVFIILFTAVYGRVFCGWLCPQTVFLEMLFRKVEYAIDGDASQQRALAQAPWTGGKLVKRVLKHGIYLLLAFIIGNVLLAYIIGSDGLKELIVDTPLQHPGGFAAMIIFTGGFYWIYAYFREQICCFLCPYGRLQSVLLDEDSIVVSYDYKRGEERGRFRKNDDRDSRAERGEGDCINCGMCQRVCPTGIDIRNGTQLECVNCTACIDACNFMMDNVGLPQGLIRYASENGIKNQDKSFKFTPRVIGYTVVLCILIGIMSALLFTRQDIEVKILRTPGQTYQVMADDTITNVFNVNVINKSFEPHPIKFVLESPASGYLQIAGGDLIATPEDVTNATIIVGVPRDQLQPVGNRIMIGIYRDNELVDHYELRFVVP